MRQIVPFRLYWSPKLTPFSRPQTPLCGLFWVKLTLLFSILHLKAITCLRIKNTTFCRTTDYWSQTWISGFKRSLNNNTLTRLSEEKWILSYLATVCWMLLNVVECCWDLLNRISYKKPLRVAFSGFEFYNYNCLYDKCSFSLTLNS